MKTNHKDGNKRPAHTPNGFWIAPGENPQEARRRAWMTPNEFRAWKSAKTDAARERIEQAAERAAAVERATEAKRRQENIKASMAKRAKMETEAAEHERRFRDATIRLAARDGGASTEKVNPIPAFAFYRDGGDVWRCIYEGRELKPVRHLAGMTYIHKLLALAGRPIDARDLYEIENPPDAAVVSRNSPEACDIAAKYGTGGHAHKILTPETRKDYQRRCKAHKIKLADSNLSPKQKDMLEDELEKLEKALSAARVARAVGGASFEDGSIKRPRQTVAGAIDRALDAIAKANPGAALVKHLRPALVRGYELHYVGGLNWKT